MDPVKKALKSQKENPEDRTGEGAPRKENPLEGLRSAAIHYCYYCGLSNDKSSALMVSKAGTKSAYGLYVHTECHNRYGKLIPMEFLKHKANVPDAPKEEAAAA